MTIDILVRATAPIADAPSPAAPSPSGLPQPTPGRDGNAMLLHEALARSRMQELQVIARERAVIRALTAGRRWQMLARFATRRAERARATA